MIVRLHGVDINVEAHEASGIDRPTLVLIHGFGASLRTWDSIVPSLSNSYPIVRADLKGFGLSAHPRDGRYSVDENAEIVVDLIARRKLSRLVLVGHSYGGAVAVMVATKLCRSTPLSTGDPAGPRVDGLVLIDAASYQQRLPYFVEVSRHALTRWFSRLVPIDRGTRQVLRSLFADTSLVDAAMVERYAFPRRIPGAHYSEVQTALQIVPESFDEVTRTIRSIDVPTQIIWGDRDRAVPPAFAHRLHKDIRGSRLEVLSNVGHMPHEERPDEVIRIVSAFLASLA